jgi:cytidylate kinase
VYIEKLSGFLILDPRKLVIAIDGPAASGKSTTARLVASRLEYLHVDTGAMYRAVTLKVLRAGLALDDRRGIGKLMESTHVELRRTMGELKVLLDGEDVTDEIRSVAVTRAVSEVSSLREVRQAMVREQRALGREGGIVLEGRDIGTVVFPEADLKFFMVAGIEARARRRRLDLAADGVNADLGTLMRDIEERDRKDSSRKESPLRKAEDALEIDTSSMTIEEQVDMVVKIAREKLGQTGER